MNWLSNFQRLQDVNLEIMDIEHLIENENFSDIACVKTIAKLKELRKKRRSLKNEGELAQKYNELKARLSSKENRQFICSEIHKRAKQFGQEYNYRVLSEEEIKFLLEDSTKSHEKKARNEQKSKDINEKILSMLEQGFSQAKIAKELGVSQPYISVRIKKMREQKDA